MTVSLLLLILPRPVWQCLDDFQLLHVSLGKWRHTWPTCRAIYLWVFITIKDWITHILTSRTRRAQDKKNRTLRLKPAWISLVICHLFFIPGKSMAATSRFHLLYAPALSVQVKLELPPCVTSQVAVPELCCWIIARTFYLQITMSQWSWPLTFWDVICHHFTFETFDHQILIGSSLSPSGCLCQIWRVSQVV